MRSVIGGMIKKYIAPDPHEGTIKKYIAPDPYAGVPMPLSSSGGGLVNNTIGVFQKHDGLLNPSSQSPTPYAMIAMRMQWDQYGRVHPFVHVSVARKPDVVLVFVVTTESHVVLEDDPNMFPSDKLVTALRLLTP